MRILAKLHLLLRVIKYYLITLISVEDCDQHFFYCFSNGGEGVWKIVVGVAWKLTETFF